MRRALYAGTFDPVTLGHVDVVARASRLFEEVVVGVAQNIKKEPLFSLEERIGMLEVSCGRFGVVIEPIEGLLVDEAARLGCQAIVRGLRNGADFDYEFAMTSMNRALAAEIETVFLVAKPEWMFTSSSLIKEVARFQGEIDAFVPDHVAAALIQRYKKLT